MFMQCWLKEHVMRTDKQYSAFLNARGARQVTLEIDSSTLSLS